MTNGPWRFTETDWHALHRKCSYYWMVNSHNMLRLTKVVIAGNILQRSNDRTRYFGLTELGHDLGRRMVERPVSDDRFDCITIGQASSKRAEALILE
ncbi:hypothetical protein D3C78_1082880 [compost metagenome]